MYLNNDRQFLKTKIVATMGEPRGGIFNPSLEKKLKNDDNFWDNFLSWFIKNNMYLIDIVRLNMSFFKPPGENEKKIIRWLRDNKKLVKNVAVLGDLQGPKPRLGNRKSKSLAIEAGEKVRLLFKNIDDDDEHFVISLGEKSISDEDPNISHKINYHINNSVEPLIISIGDDDATLKVIEATNESVECVVESGGILLRERGVTIKGIKLDLHSFQDNDREALDFLINEGYDWNEDFNDPKSIGSFLAFIGVSFVKNKDDILTVKEYAFNKILGKLKARYPSTNEKELEKKAMLFSPSIIAKIETAQAWKNIDEILDVSDGAMVARGDLAKQIGPEKVPGIQKQLIQMCNLRGKPIITATEMLASMEDNPFPTRAEANDVFNAILDGSDAIMLSGETSIGRYPYQAVRMMIKIAEAAEMQYKNFRRRRTLSNNKRRSLHEERYSRLLVGAEEFYGDIKKRLNEEFLNVSVTKSSGTNPWLIDLYLDKIRKNDQQDITDRISQAACVLSGSRANYKAILAPSASGRTVRMLSRFRPQVRLIGAAHDSINMKKMIISYGVCPINCGKISSMTGRTFADSDQVHKECCEIALEEGYLNSGDIVVFTAGTPLFTTGTTNLVQIKEVNA
ncbi:MAG: pyruvate kinase [candidate division Zixibacteria bacterium]|nr:pyruvate kinase [candidate division Zixibacteria bacterium]